MQLAKAKSSMVVTESGMTTWVRFCRLEHTREGMTLTCSPKMKWEMLLHSANGNKEDTFIAIVEQFSALNDTVLRFSQP